MTLEIHGVAYLISPVGIKAEGGDATAAPAAERGPLSPHHRPLLQLLRLRPLLIRPPLAPWFLLPRRPPRLPPQGLRLLPPALRFPRLRLCPAGQTASSPRRRLRRPLALRRRPALHLPLAPNNKLKSR